MVFSTACSVTCGCCQKTVDTYVRRINDGLGLESKHYHHCVEGVSITLESNSNNGGYLTKDLTATFIAVTFKFNCLFCNKSQIGFESKKTGVSVGVDSHVIQCDCCGRAALVQADHSANPMTMMLGSAATTLLTGGIGSLTTIAPIASALYFYQIKAQQRAALLEQTKNSPNRSCGCCFYSKATFKTGPLSAWLPVRKVQLFGTWYQVMEEDMVIGPSSYDAINRPDAKWPRGEVPFMFEFEKRDSKYSIKILALWFPLSHQLTFYIRTVSGMPLRCLVSDEMQRLVLSAVDYLNATFPGSIRFYALDSRTAIEVPHYVTFRQLPETETGIAFATSGCQTHLPDRAAHQFIALKACPQMSVGVVVHQMLHCLGLFHTHSRPNRDDFICVDNSAPHVGIFEPEEFGNPSRSDFATKLLTNHMDDSSDYDFFSIMHCPLGIPIGGNSKSQLSISPSYCYSDEEFIRELGQRKALSVDDVALVLAHYPPDPHIDGSSKLRNRAGCVVQQSHLTGKHHCHCYISLTRCVLAHNEILSMSYLYLEQPSNPPVAQHVKCNGVCSPECGCQCEACEQLDHARQQDAEDNYSLSVSVNEPVDEEQGDVEQNDDEREEEEQTEQTEQTEQSVDVAEPADAIDDEGIVTSEQ